VGEVASALLACDNLTIAVETCELVSDLSFQAGAGTFTAILGCNGAGKTLTMHALAGLRAPLRGTIRIAGQDLHRWQRRSLAQTLGLLMQTTEDPFPATVIETVLVGRHPHLQLWQWESQLDRQIGLSALAELDLTGFEHRDVSTLSGGERRRVALAALLTQQSKILLLDEPTNHLDPHHQLDVLKLLRQRANAGGAVVTTLHDVGLTAKFADQAVLLFGNGEWLCGPADSVLTEDNLSRLYRTPMREVQWEGGRTFVTV
jgi:iron complex transport system ATP-binding protein